MYATDAKAKNLSPKDRLQLHQAESLPVLDSLKDWMEHKIESRAVEPNGPLAGVMVYSLKRWAALTSFTRIEGAPLSNAEAERTIKNAITHRKNSLSYLNANGAKQGDITTQQIVGITKNARKASSHRMLRPMIGIIHHENRASAE